MASSEADKAAARAVSALTGTGYQRSLHTVQVLRELRGVADLGDLASVLAGGSPRVVGVPADVALVHDLGWALERARDGRGYVASRFPKRQARSVVPLQIDGREAWFDLACSEDLVPTGPFAFQLEDLERAVATARWDEGSSTFLPLVLRVESVDNEAEVPPDPPSGAGHEHVSIDLASTSDDGSYGRPSRAVVEAITVLLATGEPEPVPTELPARVMSWSGHSWLVADLPPHRLWWR